MSTIAKPFRSGKCQVCWSKEFLEAKKLCPTCEAYASQDYVSQQELPLLINQEQLRNKKSGTTDKLVRQNSAENFENILRAAKLTSRQRTIMRRYFLYEQTLNYISKKLGISWSTAQEHFESALKKVGNTRENSHIVRRKNNSTFASTGEGLAPSPKKRPTLRHIDPYSYYSKCPKCSGLDFQSKANKASCTKCGWTFAVYSIEEFENSHPYPFKPILDGSEY